jgi:eukaryotic-like serine/threonine-protein kinase
MRRSRNARWSPRARGRLALAVTGAIVVAGVLTLELWETPPAWLAGLRELTVRTLGWVRVHLFTATVAGLVVSIAALGMPFLTRHLDRRDTALQQHRVRDRQVMLARVRNRWIAGVLDQSLANQVWIRLETRRRPEAIQRPDMLLRRAGGNTVLVPAGMSIGAVFDRLGGGLLILGAPGSGKTTALLELARDLLDRAEADERQPIPVVFSLSSWAGRRPPFEEWMVDQLRNHYRVPRSIAAQWVSRDELLPLLDGLDEVAAPHRAGCVHAINGYLRAHGLTRVVVCSRTQQYTALATTLQLEEAVELQPPTHQQVIDYLATAGRALEDVSAALDADPSLWDLVRSPLVLAIATLTYLDRPAEALRTTGTPEQRLARLFDAYTERMFEHRSGRYPLARTRHWLAWLARRMYAGGQSEFHLDRLQPSWLPSTTSHLLATTGPVVGIGLVAGLVTGPTLGWLNGLAVGLFFTLTFGLSMEPSERPRRWSRVHAGVRVGLVVGLVLGLLAGLHGGLAAGLVEGLFFAVFGGLLSALRRTEPAEEVRWSWWRARFGLSVGLAGGLACGLIYGQRIGLAAGLLFGLCFGLAFGLGFGLVPGLVTKRTVPNEGIHRSARRAVAIGPFFGLFFAVPFGLAFGLAEALLFELFFGLAGGLVFGGLACLRHMAVRVLLTAHGVAPLRLVRFLDEATERLLLRRTGGGYIFIHRLLLEHLAAHDAQADAREPAVA